MISTLKPSAVDLDAVLSFRLYDNAYSRQVAMRLCEEAYEMRFRGLLVNEAELAIVKHLVRGSGGALLNEGNMSLIHEHAGTIESMPLLVALVNGYQAFDAAQRNVDASLKGSRAKLVSRLFDHFHYTVNLLAQVALMELSVLAGEDRTVEWASVRSDVAFDRLALAQYRFALTLTGENACAKLIQHLDDVTLAFERAQQPLGYLGAAITERRWRR